MTDAQDVLDLISDIEISGDPDDSKEILTNFYVSILSHFLDQTRSVLETSLPFLVGVFRLREGSW